MRQPACRSICSDVKKLDWFYSDVEAMWRAGFIKGTSETTYSPEDSISRAQIVTILFRMDGERRTDVPAAFEDVPAGAYWARPPTPRSWS